MTLKRKEMYWLIDIDFKHSIANSDFLYIDG